MTKITFMTYDLEMSLIYISGNSIKKIVDLHTRSMNESQISTMNHFVKNGTPFQPKNSRLQSIQTLTFILLTMLISLTSVNLAQAQEPSPEVNRVRLALAGDDANEKKTAPRAIAEPDIGTDDEVIPLLILAIDDRQGGESAVNALILRTGQTPVSGEWKNNMRTTRSAWINWFQKWKQGQRIKNLEKSPETDKETQVEKNKPIQTPVKQDAAVNRIVAVPKDEMGKLNRILFKSGGRLVCFIKEITVDGDGNLLNVRIVHEDGMGEETIDATLITRIDDVAK